MKMNYQMMSGYNIAIERLWPEMPDKLKKLPVDERGFPIPKFVASLNGKPDFRVADSDFMVRAVKQKLCWLCGEPLGRFVVFVVGPMCCINHLSSEPPSHLACAEFACKACPFLTNPNRGRNEHNLPEDAHEPGGTMIRRNPSVAAIWVTRGYEVFRPSVGHPGVLFRIGDPERVKWMAKGRIASRAEVMASIDGGLPQLQKMAEEEGPEAVADLKKKIVDGLALVPAA
jgi:hypothetical protein